jgi:hypothetical protein
LTAQEYISSGAIEACLSGKASAQEWEKLQQMMAIHPSVKEAKEELEKVINNPLDSSISVNPPLSKKLNTMHSSTDLQTKENTIEANTAASTQAASSAKPVNLPIVPVPKPVKWLQRALAISVILLMGSILLNFHFYSKSVGNKKNFEAIVSNISAIKAPGIKEIVLPGTEFHPKSSANIYWDTTNSRVYLVLTNLEEPPSGKQYQLWAYKNGKPENAGLVSKNNDLPIVKMQDVTDAGGFGVSLEKEGGASTPTQESMCVFATFP